MRRVPRLAAVVILAASPGVGQSPWRVEQPVDGPRLARAGEEGGATFTVTAGPSRYSAACRLDLPAETDETLAGDRLVTVTVDDGEPLTVLRWQGQPEEDDGGDFFETIRRASGGIPLSASGPRWIEFLCWPALRGQQSPATGALREILDGADLRVRYATVESGTREARFPLAGARETIAAALQISAEPSALDVAQAELLRFRFDYRSNTCYLLGGRKRQNRCLEAVKRCSEKVHDSVLSMRECIEGR